ncbi:unnamed protein product [Moneuplotes crassus]|uniref:RING-type domain-containing protein n=1 Tax=Euplotes crassus TaxID=5936 RepID=A0AAD1XJZ3_EUPCR|nr:unnamed protein product [Moneuplotes crassus]
MEKRKCQVCLEEEEEPDELSIICQNKHFICSECADNFIISKLHSLEVDLPFKCCVCNIPIEESQIEKHLDDDQKHTYEIYSKFVTLDSKKYRIHSCPSSCGYKEILNWSELECPFFICQKEDCKKGSCIICQEFYQIPDEEVLSQEQHAELVLGSDGISKHLTCLSKKDVKDEWERCIDAQNSRPCPRCGLRGIKDDSCAHITCPKCNTKWCYVCGLDENDCDKEGTQDDPNKLSIYRHNDNWSTNSKRCPMYLRCIIEIDSRYSESDEQCMEFLHKLLFYKEIRQFINKYSEEVLYDIFKTFPKISVDKIIIDEAMTTDLTIIKR